MRDAEGAERCIVSAVQAGASPRELADMFFAAATDHRYVEGGHTLDFINKACEALDAAGWDRAGDVLPSLVAPLGSADRMEESNEWRHPVDLVEILEGAFEELPRAVEAGRARGGAADGAILSELGELLLGEDAAAIAGALLDALRAVGGAAARCLRRRHERLPRPVPQRAAGAVARGRRVCGRGGGRWGRGVRRA